MNCSSSFIYSTFFNKASTIYAWQYVHVLYIVEFGSKDASFAHEGNRPNAPVSYLAAPKEFLGKPSPYLELQSSFDCRDILRGQAAIPIVDNSICTTYPLSSEFKWWSKSATILSLLLRCAGKSPVRWNHLNSCRNTRSHITEGFCQDVQLDPKSGALRTDKMSWIPITLYEEPIPHPKRGPRLVLCSRTAHLHRLKIQVLLRKSDRRCCYHFQVPL